MTAINFEKSNFNYNLEEEAEVLKSNRQINNESKKKQIEIYANLKNSEDSS